LTSIVIINFKKMKFKLYFSLPLLTIFFSCAENSTDDLVDATQPVTVTYSNTIKAVIDNNCIGCHNSPPVAGAPMPLLTYENVKDAIQNRGLLDRISRDQGASGMMPLGGSRLPQTTINLFSQWQSQGLAE
jgi:hypothetical protein